MANAQYSLTLAIAGESIQQSIVRSSDTGFPYKATLPAGKSGTLSTRTDNDTGVVTATAHGLAVNDKVDVYWSGAGNVRYGMTVITVADANTATVDGGSGDNLPVVTTAVVVTKQVVINTDVDGDTVLIVGICAESTNASSTTNAHAHIQDVASATVTELDLVANAPRVWDVTGGSSNVFAPTVSATFTADNTNETITSAAHGLVDGQQVRVSNSGGGLPAGLSAGVWYYVIASATNTFKLATTLGGSAIDITSNGTGTQTWTRRNKIATTRASNGSSSEDLTFKFLVLQDVTP